MYEHVAHAFICSTNQTISYKHINVWACCPHAFICSNQLNSYFGKHINAWACCPMHLFVQLTNHFLQTYVLYMLLMHFICSTNSNYFLAKHINVWAQVAHAFICSTNQATWQNMSKCKEHAAHAFILFNQLDYFLAEHINVWACCHAFIVQLTKLLGRHINVRACCPLHLSILFNQLNYLANI
jgi:hypothetical protein